MKQIIIEQAEYKVSDHRVFSLPALTINQHESWAFVGSNGSGKSTLAKIFANKQTLLSGCGANQFSHIAYLSFEELQRLIEEDWKRNNTDLLSADEDDTGIKTIELIQEFVQDEPLCIELARQFGIEHLLSRRFKYLSTGETRKTLLCRSLMLQPDLLILDEPFDGLDVASRQQLSNLLSELTKQGITLILIGNRFNEIPDFIQHVGVLMNCRLIKTGSYHSILQDEAIKQINSLEAFAHLSLPQADEQTEYLADNIPRIILKNGYVHYNDKPIINQLNWQVNAKENWQIIGPNGAGKSTLLSLITGDHPQGYSNDLTLFGRKRGSGETIWDIKRHIGYVSSSLHLNYRVNTSVKNVLLSGYFDSIGVYCAVSDKLNKLADEWLNLLGLMEYANTPFHLLSWGQQRLLLIVRALVKYPTLLILDEPLQGLDELNRELVKRWIDRLIRQGDTQLLFVSHHADDAPKCITHQLLFVPVNGTYHYQFNLVTNE